MSHVKRPTPALLLALFALCISLGGTSTAANIKHAVHPKDARNADSVNWISASRKPQPGKLLALGKNGKFPARVIPTSAQGVKGEAGSPGTRGETGAAGDDGATGAQGDDGATGATGAPGAPGASMLSANTGPIQITGGSFLEQNQRYFAADSSGSSSPNQSEVAKPAPSDLSLTSLRVYVRINQDISWAGISVLGVAIYRTDSPFAAMNYGDSQNFRYCYISRNGATDQAGTVLTCTLTDMSMNIGMGQGIALAAFTYDQGQSTTLHATFTTAIEVQAG